MEYTDNKVLPIGSLISKNISLVYLLQSLTFLSVSQIVLMNPTSLH